MGHPGRGEEEESREREVNEEVGRRRKREGERREGRKGMEMEGRGEEGFLPRLN